MTTQPDRVPRFAGQLAVVTGAGGAIGSATARRLASEGARIVAVDLHEAAVARTVAAIRQAGGEADGVTADVSCSDDVVRYAEAAAGLGGGRIDLLFNNAGVEGPVTPIEQVADEAFDRVFAVNVRGVYLGLKHVLPHMQSGGAIVNAGSTASLRGEPEQAVYVASKHAVLGLTRSVSREVAPRGIRVNAVCPGPIATEMMVRIEQDYGAGGARDRFEAMVPLGRYGGSDEVAASVAFLLSDDARFITGAAHSVDGGLSA